MSYTRTGLLFQVCNICGQKISVNALARGGHEKGDRHQAALQAAEEKRLRVEQVRRQIQATKP